MNINDIEKMNKSIIENAIDWANNRDCLPLEPYDIIVISEHYNIRIPACFHNFVCSDSPNQVKASGAFKTIYNTMDKIRNTIIKAESN